MTTFTIHTEDKEQLNALKAFMKALKIKYEINKIDVQSDWWNNLSQENKVSIEKGLVDIENGKVFSDEEVRNSIRQKLIKANK